MVSQEIKALNQAYEVLKDSEIITCTEIEERFDKEKEMGLTLTREQEAQAPTARQLLAFPKEERTRILRAQAEQAAAEYETDLARPVAERELTAFTTLDGEPFCDYPAEGTPRA